ncbi:hypothetical protein G7054_g4760 [Neopestalotiopsis clavispora]|nr:hypothetical protein G7054_g4760 [Neopestalotiopsis clavispora]
MALSQSQDAGNEKSGIDFYHFTPLPLGQQRFFILHPCNDDPEDEANVVRGSFEYGNPESIGHYTAITHGRGFRKIYKDIEVDGQKLRISWTLEVFLRHYRLSHDKLRIWTRYLCLDQSKQEEKLNLWTRPFVNFMYDHAHTKVDMIDYVHNLLDKGQTKQVAYADAMGRRKEWDNNNAPVLHVLDRLKSQSIEAQGTYLPQVYPIWLGAQPSYVGPYGRYKYIPLDPICDEIRLIVLEPANSRDDPIRMTMCHEPICSNVRYYCLSYTWGSSTETVDCYMSGQMISIRDTLRECLVNLRRKEHIIVLWVDAICINQDDVAERNRQVPRMGEIFYNAAAVICYVGDSAEKSDEAFDLADSLQSPLPRRNALGDWEAATSYSSEADFATACAALYRLLTRPYFQRVWIIQEIALASAPTIMCGSRVWGEVDALAQAGYQLQYMMSVDPDLMHEMNAVLRQATAIDLEKIDNFRKLQYFPRLLRDHDNELLAPCIFQDSPPYLDTAILMRQFQCKVDHDKIFGIWNLAGDKHLLRYDIDYSGAAQDKFIEFTVAHAAAHGKLDIIATAELDPNDPTELDSKAPSWCTDWCREAKSSCLVGRERLPSMPMFCMPDQSGQRYMADGNMRQDIGSTDIFAFENGVLIATAVVLDVLTETNLFGRESRSVGELFHMAKTNDRLIELTAANYYDPERSVLATLHGDSVAAWHVRDEQSEIMGRHPNKRYVCNPAEADDHPNWPLPGNKSRYIDHHGDTSARYESHSAAEVRQMIMRGRYFGITADGYFCLVPDYIKPCISSNTYYVASLATCSVPLLLLEVEGEPGSYRLLGS